MKEKKGWGAFFEAWLFDGCALQTCALMRVGFGLLVLVYGLVWLRDAQFWFSNQGVVSVETITANQPATMWSIFFWIEPNPGFVTICLTIMLLNAVLLTLGCFGRLQAAFIFFWLVSFQNRNSLIGDGEDSVFRLFAFFLIWMPLDRCYSVTRLLEPLASSIPKRSEAAWALRLVQVQMAIIYLSAACSKLLSPTWQDGSAVYYVYQMHDNFGRGPLPAFLMETEWLIRLTTWGTMLVEACMPFLLFLPRTRRAGIALGFLLHLSMEYSMHLFLFQWIMMLGLLAFTKPEDSTWFRRWTPEPDPHPYQGDPLPQRAMLALPGPKRSGEPLEMEEIEESDNAANSEDDFIDVEPERSHSR